MSEVVTDLTRGVYRRLYGGFTTGQRINKLSLSAEAWFWRVLVSVDDFGNGRADPDLCRDATAGRRKVTAKQVSEWLGEMRHVGLIQFYIVKDEPYLHVTGFEVTQPAGKNGRRIRRFPRPDESEGIQDIPDAVSASDSEDEDDSDNDTERRDRAAKPRSPRKPKSVSDEEFLSELQNDEAYKRLDVRLLHAKMVRWCIERNKVPTRARLINWLNREDQPMETNGTNKSPGHQTNAERRDAEFRGYAEVVSGLRSKGSGGVDETVRRKSLTS